MLGSTPRQPLLRSSHPSIGDGVIDLGDGEGLIIQEAPQIISGGSEAQGDLSRVGDGVGRVESRRPYPAS
jgi:hypothetical protein